MWHDEGSTIDTLMCTDGSDKKIIIHDSLSITGHLKFRRYSVVTSSNMLLLKPRMHSCTHRHAHTHVQTFHLFKVFKNIYVNIYLF